MFVTQHERMHFNENRKSYQIRSDQTSRQAKRDKKRIRRKKESLDMTEMSRVNACNRFIDGNEVTNSAPQNKFSNQSTWAVRDSCEFILIDWLYEQNFD